MGLDLDDLTEPERGLWEAFRTGAELDLRAGDAAVDEVGAADGWGEERTVRARVIVALLLGAQQAEPGHVAALRLTGARIVGVVDLDYAEVRYHLRLKDCSIPERVYLYGARTRQVSLVGSHLPGGLEMSLAVVDGNLRLIGCRIEGGLSLAGTRVAGAVLLNRARLANPGAPALNGPRLHVDGDLSCTEGFEARGEVNLRGARIAGDASFAEATLSVSGGVALRASACEVGGGLLCDEVTACGQLRIRRARIGGSVWFTGARVRTEDEEFAVYAADAEIGMDLRFGHNFIAEGGVEISDISVGAHIRLDGATLTRPQGDALVARGITVGGDVHCADGFTALGAVRFNGARISGFLNFRDADLTASHGFALTLTRASARELDLRTATAPAEVDLSHATVGVIRDSAHSWPATLRLNGLRYEQLDQPGTAKERADWLERDDRLSYVPEPFEQLAAFYRRIGHDDEARRVLLAKQRARRRTLSASARGWGALQDAVVGYGYRPERALAWLVGLLGLGTLAFGLHPPRPIGTGSGPPFNPLIYSLDLLLPVINFGVSRAYTSDGAYQWLAYLLTAAGWILATAIAAGVARAVNRA